MVPNREYPRVTLWHDLTHTRHFLIPNNTVLPPGPLRLKTYTHKRLAVDPGAAVAFELSAEETQRWLLDNLDHATSDIRRVIREWIDTWRPKMHPEKVTRNETAV